jgi:hypothetical protein
MSGKIAFGVDYLVLMRELVVRSTNQGEPIDLPSDAAARFFLLQWEFSPDEIDQANRIYWEMCNNNNLPQDLYPVAKRIADHIMDDPVAQQRLVVELAAIGTMDGSVTPAENQYVYWFRDILDMRPSEFQSLLARGYSMAIGLNYFGQVFASSRGTNSPYHPSPP